MTHGDKLRSFSNVEFQVDSFSQWPSLVDSLKPMI